MKPAANSEASVLAEIQPGEAEPGEAPPETAQPETAQSLAWRGFKAVLPLVPGIVPFAIIAGSSAIEVGIPAIQAAAMSIFIFAGAAQLVMIEMWAQEAPAMVLLVTTLLVNLRFTMYSATLAPHLQEVGSLRKSSIAYLLTDQAGLLSLPEFETAGERASWFFLSGAATLWVFWQAGSLFGIVLGGTLPESWSLDFAVPLSFLALLIPAIKSRGTAVAALTAGGLVLLTRFLPLNLGLIVATLIGVAAGMLSERHS